MPYASAVSQKLKAEYDSKFMKLSDQVKVKESPLSFAAAAALFGKAAQLAH